MTEPLRSTGRAARASVAALAMLAAIVPGALVAQLRDARPAPAPSPPTVAGVYDSTHFRGLEWRNIGPFRGGRVTAVAGVAGDPLTHYFGATGGGVWKTDDAGLSWKNISDGWFHTGSVGSIAVAATNARVIYVGMGEAPVRGVSSSEGDGVYKSTDGGKRWSHLGLEATKTISRVIVDPRDENVVYVAAQGSRWAPSADRGIYKTTDGGKSWKKMFFVDSLTGPSELSIDVTNPRVLYAAMWDHQRLPWRVRSGGPGSGIWKTADAGETWTRLSKGLPKMMGKTSVAVSPANPERVWAMIEADDGGLFRSDDAGETWTRTNDERQLRARAWYYIHLFADPKDESTVYVLNAPAFRSTDGGKTFAVIPSPHGDNHALWIDPQNNQHLINGNDGGATISLNGGKSWSSQYNQPTAQFYRVNTDDLFPYRVYGGQQDNTSVGIASRTNGGGIGDKDWESIGGCESAVPAFDPKNPVKIYAGCYQGIIEEFDTRTKNGRSIMPYAENGLSMPSDQLKYRYSWSAPIITSPHDRRVIYHGGNVLFRSTDGGTSWTPISPDLTRNDKTKQGPGGVPITNEGAGGEVYNTIFWIAESPFDAQTIWVGTDDGLVQLTRDGGKTWTNVTPKGVGEALTYVIEPSPHDAATAYVALTRFKFGDATPYLFRTGDYGKTWTKITNGLPATLVTRTVRADPVRRGLLYAGTENGVWLSFDAGARWQPLPAKFPPVPVTDLQVRQNDLVVSTEGRAFWILDDLSPLQQMTDVTVAAAAHLYVPRPTVRLPGGRFGLEASPGKNPPNGAHIWYTLARTPDSTSAVKIEILDATGRVIRTLSSQPAADTAERGAGSRPYTKLEPKAGLNVAVWDLRVELLKQIPGLFSEQPPDGYMVAAGSYSVRLSAAGKVLTQPLTVLDDPRVTLSVAERKAHDAVSVALYDRISEITDAVITARDVRTQVTDRAVRATGEANGAAIDAQGKVLTTQLTAAETTLVQPKKKTFQDVVNYAPKLVDQYTFAFRNHDGSDGPVTEGVRLRVADLEIVWVQQRDALRQTLDGELAKFNALFVQGGIPAVILPKQATRAATVVP